MSNERGVKSLGVIGSSGGSALAAADACLKAVGESQEWVVVADRSCGIFDWAAENARRRALIEYVDPETFSAVAHEFFLASGVSDVILFYTRRVAAPLINKMAVCNIHPSLLPDFPGVGAVRRARAQGRSTIGATLHRVDAGLDTGPILLQTRGELELTHSLAQAERLSFLQKIWLLLVWRQTIIGSHQTFDSSSVPHEIREAFIRLQPADGPHFVPD